MANSYVQYTGTGSQTAFSVTFPYIAQSHVKVLVNDIVVNNYTWSNASQITFAAAPANGATITIRRATPSTPLVDFTAKSRWQTSDLNTSTKQALYIAEEAEEQASTWYTGAGAAASTSGVQGDFYIDTTGGGLYRKGVSAWNYLMSVKGPSGHSFRIIGTLANTGLLPVSGMEDGDSYLIGGVLYNWSATTSSWLNLGSIVGPQGVQGLQGIQGVQGIQGPDGTNGALWFTSAGAPSAGLGSIGDFFLDSTAADFYQKTGASTWTVRGNLKGATGATGATGPQGAQGIQGIQGVQGLAGATGSAGANGFDGGLKFYFSTTITDSDPGNGTIRFNSTVPLAVAWLYIDILDGDGNLIEDWLKSLDDSSSPSNKGSLYIRQQASGNVAVYQVTGSVVDGTGYYKIPVTYVTGARPVDGATLSVFFTRTGDQGVVGSGAGDMLRSTYDTNANGKVDIAEVADAAPWSGITGKPTTFQPSTHVHPTSEVTGLDTALANLQPLDPDLTSIAGLAGTSGLLRKTAANTWSLDTSTFSVAGHTHAQSDVTNLVTDLANKQPLNANLTSISALTDPNANRIAYWNDSVNQWSWMTIGTNLTLSSGTLSATNTGVWGQVTGTLSAQTDLQSALDAKASTASLAGYLPLGGGTISGAIYSSASSLMIGQAGGATRGYVYNDTSGIGFLTNTGGWAARVNYGTTDFAVVGSLLASGNVVAYYSDKRLKKDIRPIEDALSKINKISGVTYYSNEVAAKYGYGDPKRQVGVIAQEIREVLPEVVVPAPFDTATGEDGKSYSKSGEGYVTVMYEKMVPLLIEAVKELSAQVKELEDKINDLTR